MQRGAFRRQIRFDEGIGEVEPGAMAPLARGHRAHHPVSHHHRRAAMGRSIPAVEREAHQLAHGPGLLPRQQGFLTDKLLLAQIDKAVQPGLEGIELGQQIGLPVQIALFQPHTLHGPNPEQLEIVRRPRRAERPIGGVEVRIGDVDFVGQLAREADGHHHRRRDADEGLPHRQPREARR